MTPCLYITGLVFILHFWNEDEKLKREPELKSRKVKMKWKSRTGERKVEERERPFDVVCERMMSIHPTMKIYNILGQELLTLEAENEEMSSFTFIRDSKGCFGNDIANRIYLYHLNPCAFIPTKRMICLSDFCYFYEKY